MSPVGLTYDLSRRKYEKVAKRPAIYSKTPKTMQHTPQSQRYLYPTQNSTPHPSRQPDLTPTNVNLPRPLHPQSLPPPNISHLLPHDAIELLPPIKINMVPRLINDNHLGLAHIALPLF